MRSTSPGERLWIVSPYFVPDEQLMSALHLAALRGVDVRILIPENPDQKLVYYSSFSYLEEAEKSGVKLYRYQPVFTHVTGKSARPAGKNTIAARLTRKGSTEELMTEK